MVKEVRCRGFVLRGACLQQQAETKKFDGVSERHSRALEPLLASAPITEDSEECRVSGTARARRITRWYASVDVPSQ